MKFISFNTWDGRAGIDSLKDFFIKYQDVEIFCFQEILQGPDNSVIEMMDLRNVTDLLEKIASFFPEHRYFFCPL